MTDSAARIVTPGGADNQGIGPKNVAINDNGTKTSGSAFGTGPADTITQESEFHTEASGRYDTRGDAAVLLTPANFGAGDTLTVTIRTADGTDYAVGAITHGTATNSDWQTAIRAALPGTDLATVAGSANGAMTITWNPNEFYGRRYPKITGVVGTGGASATWAPVDDAGVTGGTKRYLGETKYEGTTELVGPTQGTITVTDAVDEVQTVSFSAGTDGGRIRFGFRQGRSSSFAWNAELADIAAEMAAEGGMFDQCNALTTADAPTVRWATPSVLEVEFVDWDTTDDAILTYDTTDASDSLEFATVDAGASAAARAAIITAWVKTIDAFVDSDITSSEVTENYKYNVTFHDAPRSLLAADFALAVTGTTNEDATPDAITVLDAEAGIQFTFENGNLAGRPVRGGVNILEDTLEDGGVLEPATLTVTTAGVLGSASVAYTEQTTVGDSVFGQAVNDTTGKGGTTAAAADTDSPVVFAGLVPGTYVSVLRTVAGRALSAPSTKAFTVSHA